MSQQTEAIFEVLEAVEAVADRWLGLCDALDALFVYLDGLREPEIDELPPILIEGGEDHFRQSANSPATRESEIDDLSPILIEGRKEHSNPGVLPYFNSQ